MERRNLLRAALAGAVAVPAGARLLGGTADAAPASYRVLVTRVDGGSDRVMEFDRRAPSFTSPYVKWELRPGWGDVLEARYRHTSNDGDVVLVAAGDSPSKGRVGIYRKRDRKRLWWDAVTNYPHSIERVPGSGAVIVAGAGTARPGPGKPRPNGSLRLYGPRDGHIASLGYIRSYPLQEAHGVLWDPLYELLWAIGRTEVRRYRVKGSYRRIRLEEVGAAHRIRIRGNGHDLQPDYTDKHRLLLTDTNHVYALDKRTLKVEPLPAPLGNRHHVKSIVRHASGEYVWAGVPEGSDSHFGGPDVHFYPPADHRGCGRGAVTYKTRIAVTGYQ
ncbi:hypothetical protein ACZ90_18170 [Streptomyces albus subsp. albus]|nr:hypothetical protein ACZ90_18170 [Streptomyces albus subsp. albus]